MIAYLAGGFVLDPMPHIVQLKDHRGNQCAGIRQCYVTRNLLQPTEVVVLAPVDKDFCPGASDSSACQQEQIPTPNKERLEWLSPRSSIAGQLLDGTAKTCRNHFGDRTSACTRRNLHPLAERKVR